MDGYILIPIIFVACIVFGLRGHTGGAAGPWMAIGILVIFLAPNFEWYDAIPVREARAIVNQETGFERELPTEVIHVNSDEDGHFRVGTWVLGRRISMLVDTGATAVVLTYEDAMSIGLPDEMLTYNVPIETANGTTFGAFLLVAKIRIGNIVRSDVEVIVAKPETLSESLLGMSFLNSVGRVELRGSELVLLQ